MNRKGIMIICYFVFIILISISGTKALLINGDGIVNTFTQGNIKIALEEADTGLDEDEDRTTNTYEMFPENKIIKDPTITVMAGSEACWLFVEIDEINNFDQYLSYEIASEWRKLSDKDNVWFLSVAEEDVISQNITFSILENNTVVLKENVTKDVLEEIEINANKTGYPGLNITGYAVQYAGFEESALEAWYTVEN